MGDNFYRQLLMLHTLPRAPGKITTSAIKRHLSAAGHDISLRSVQRDLEVLSESFAITSDNAKPAGWNWSKDAASIAMPALDAHSALVLQLAKKHLEQILPVDTLGHLAPQFRQAAETLDTRGIGLRKWQNKVRVLPRGIKLATPKIDAEVQSVVYDALLKDKKIKVRYRPRLDKPKDYEINPLGLIVRDRVTYLIFEYDNKLRQLLLHRIVSAELLDTPSKCPIGFDLDAYILQGEMNFPNGREIKLCFALNEFAARQLRDCPLSADQNIIETDNGSDDVIIEATVQDSMELRWWLLAFGAQAEIHGPAELRAWFKDEAEHMVSYYAGEN